MSRALEFIQRLVCQTGLNATWVKSIRVTNDPVREGVFVTRVTTEFAGSKFDDLILGAISNSGHYLEDEYLLFFADATTVLVKDIVELKKISTGKSVDKVEFGFSFEKKPLTVIALVKALQTNSIFGLPKKIIHSLPVSQVKVFFGASLNEVNLFKDSKEGVGSYEGNPYVIETIATPHVEFMCLDELGRLEYKKIGIDQYVPKEMLDELVRYSFTPKVGLKIYGLFSVNTLSAEVPFKYWQVLKAKCIDIVGTGLSRHQQAQLERINSRITAVSKRKRVSFHGEDLGCEPSNEVETVLLFQRMSLLSSNPFPNGMVVKILDYSPQDIDSICDVKMSRSHPSSINPVEFEFSLKNFFLHGHDYRQVKLVICYTVAPLNFPYLHGGITYQIDNTGGITKIKTTDGHHCFDCLVLQDIVTTS